MMPVAQNSGGQLPTVNEEDIQQFREQLAETTQLLQAFLELQGVKTPE